MSSATREVEWERVARAQTRKLENVLHIPGVKEALKEIDWSKSHVELIRMRVERVARALCRVRGVDPYALEPGDAAGVDGTCRNGDPGHFKWKDYMTEAAVAVITLDDFGVGLEHYGIDPTILGG